jgi:FG-GAP-like repeat
VRTGTYDEFGRAKTATREDGTVVQINPVEVQGLLSQAQTTNLSQIPTAINYPTTPVSTYVDGNGQVQRTVLNQRGQVISQTDGIGAETSKTYNSNYLVNSQTDANGHLINYEYDSIGNAIKVTEKIQVSTTVASPGTDLFENVIESFTPIAPIIELTYYPTVAHGDINQDGIDDIISVGNNDKTNVLLGDPLNPLNSKYTISTLPFDQSHIIDQIELKDVNNDGKLDLIANLPIEGIQGNDPILVFLNQGSGQFSQPTILPLSATSLGFATGDFNGDGKSDILVYCAQNSTVGNVNSLVLFAGDDQGNFTEESIVIPGTNYDYPTTAQGYFGSNTRIKSIDVDNDGRTELIINSSDNLTSC